MGGQGESVRDQVSCWRGKTEFQQVSHIKVYMGEGKRRFSNHAPCKWGKTEFQAVLPTWYGFAIQSFVKRREAKRGEVDAIAFHQRPVLLKVAAIFSCEKYSDHHSSTQAITGSTGDTYGVACLALLFGGQDVEHQI